MLRYIAKNIVANGMALKCEIGASYIIGEEEPCSLYLNTYGTNKIDEKEILKVVREKFDLRPKSVIEFLNLRKPIYLKTTNYGHFGKKYMEYEKLIQL